MQSLIFLFKTSAVSIFQRTIYIFHHFQHRLQLLRLLTVFHGLSKSVFGFLMLRFSLVRFSLFRQFSAWVYPYILSYLVLYRTNLSRVHCHICPTCTMIRYSKIIFRRSHRRSVILNPSDMLAAGLGEVTTSDATSYQHIRQRCSVRLSPESASTPPLRHRYMFLDGIYKLYTSYFHESHANFTPTVKQAIGRSAVILLPNNGTRTLAVNSAVLTGSIAHFLMVGPAPETTHVEIDRVWMNGCHL